MTKTELLDLFKRVGDGEIPIKRDSNLITSEPETPKGIPQVDVSRVCNVMA